MDALDIVARVAGLVATISAGGLAVVYQRQLSIKATESHRAAVQVQAISALEVRMRILESTVASRDLSIEQCERARAAAEATIKAWHDAYGFIWNHGSATPDAGD